MKMKVLLLVLTFASVAYLQDVTTTETPMDDCLSLAVQELNDSTCATQFSELQASVMGGNPPTQAQVEQFCSSTCAPSINNLYRCRCGSDIITRVCSRDATGFCFPRLQDIETMAVQVITSSCSQTDCSDPTCNQAIQGLTCCVESALSSVMGGPDTILPGGCEIQECISMLPTVAPGSEGCDPGTNTTGNFECLDQRLSSLPENCVTDFDNIVQSQTDPTAFCSTQCAIDYRAAYTICGFTGLEANPVNAVCGSDDCLEQRLVGLQNCEAERTTNPAFCSTICAIDLGAAYTDCGLTGNDNPVEAVCGSTGDVTTPSTTVDPLDCIILATDESTTCSETIDFFLRPSNTSEFTDAVLRDFCTSACALTLHNQFISACGQSIIPSICGQDDVGYCHVRGHDIQTMFGQVVSASCPLGIGCSDTTCNQAIQSVSCCVETLLGGAGSSGFLPENCEIEACPTRFDPPTSTPGSTNPMPGSTNPMPGNSALKFIAMPLAILTAFLVAIVTHVHL